MATLEKKTKDEIINIIIEKMNSEIICSQNNADEMHFTDINDKRLHEIYCFSYNYEGHKMIELQIAWWGIGCFAYRKKVLFIDGDKNYINSIRRSYGYHFNKILKMTKKNIENTVTV